MYTIIIEIYGTSIKSKIGIFNLTQDTYQNESHVHFVFLIGVPLVFAKDRIFYVCLNPYKAV